MVVVSEPVEIEPDVAPPVEKPVPVHDVALVEDQERFDALPEYRVVGVAERSTVGAAEHSGG